MEMVRHQITRKVTLSDLRSSLQAQLKGDKLESRQSLATTSEKSFTKLLDQTLNPSKLEQINYIYPKKMKIGGK